MIQQLQKTIDRVKRYGSESTDGWDGPDHLAKPNGYTLAEIESWCNDSDPCFEVSEEDIKAVGRDLVSALETSEQISAEWQNKYEEAWREKQVAEERLAVAERELAETKHELSRVQADSETKIERYLSEQAQRGLHLSS